MDKFDQILEMISEWSNDLHDNLSVAVSKSNEIEIETLSAQIEILDTLYSKIETIKNQSDD